MAPEAQLEPDEPEEGFRLRLLSAEEEAQLTAGSAAPESRLPEVADAELPGLVAKLRADIQGLRVENERLEVRLRSAERRMTEGMKPKEAYAFAASRMSGPVIAATLTLSYLMRRPSSSGDGVTQAEAAHDILV